MKRQLTGCLLGALMVLAACSGQPADESSNGEPGTEQAAGSSAKVELPSSPAGEQLAWFLDRTSEGTMPAGVYRERFDDAFRTDYPHEQMQQFVDELGELQPIEILTNQPRHLTVLVRWESDGMDVDEAEISIRVGQDEVIEGLLVSPHVPRPDPPESWAALETRLDEVAAETSFLAAEVTDDGRCVPIHEIRSGTARPIASLFKLYVLDTVAREVERGTLEWDTELTIDAEVKSLGSGTMYHRANGSTVTVAKAATRMIEISDNTATDLLIREVGRESVEDTIRRTSDHAEANIPLLTTRELFQLKTVDYPDYAETYVDLPREERATWLRDTLGDVELEEQELWQRPRHIEDVEWFAAPDDVCRSYAELTERDGVDEILSANDGGLDLDPDQWATVWFKGGNEPGVSTLGYLAETTDGSRYVLTAMAADGTQLLDQSTTMAEMLSLLEGGFALVR